MAGRPLFETPPSLSLNSRSSRPNRAALKIASIYIVIGSAWILFSDAILLTVVKDLVLYRELQTYKGWGFVMVTSIILFFLVRRKIAAILAANQDLQSSEEKFRRIVETASEGIWTIDAEGRTTFVNRAMARMLEYGEEEMMGTELFSYMDEQSIPLAEQFLERRKEGFRELHEFRFRKKDGSTIWALVKTSPILGEDGGYQGALAMVADISKRKQAEEELRRLNEELEARVAERTEELQSRNRELETFTYSVSHDLKAPLRGIEGYSSLLEKEYGSRIAGEGRDFIRNIRNAVQQMNQLIDDLLAYSRLERRVLRNDLIDPGKIVEEVLGEGLQAWQGQGVELAVEVSCPSVRGDAEGLSLALRNLLDNAVKFSRGAAGPVISIGSEQTDGSCILWVRDNGIGFDMRFHDRIFEIFQRLHRVDEYPGTGIGLALVRRAMERMGGGAWAESEPGRGSTFFLKIPL